MINKDKFINILERLKATDDTVKQINDILYNCRDTVEADFTSGSSMMICHEDLVIELLENMFDTDMISYFIYELDYGKKYIDGCVQNSDGSIIDISTSEKLYDYLLEESNEIK